jgi:hypothetical protein
LALEAGYDAGRGHEVISQTLSGRHVEHLRPHWVNGRFVGEKTHALSASRVLAEPDGTTPLRHHGRLAQPAWVRNLHRSDSGPMAQTVTLSLQTYGPGPNLRARQIEDQIECPPILPS